MDTQAHVSDSASRGPSGDRSVGLLRGTPSYLPKNTDLQQNYLELDPDNPTRLLEYFSDLLRHGNLEPSDAQKCLMKELQVGRVSGENSKSS